MDDQNEERMEEAYDEGELSDDEFEELSYDDWLDRVESNDPSLTSVLISTLILIPNDDADRNLVERLSTAIGRNTQLKAVMFNGRLSEAQTVNLFRGIACNQSIKRLHFYNCGGYVGDICRTLTPLFKNNQVERMTFHSCKLSIEGTRLLAASLAEFDSLKEFDLTHARIQQIPPEVARDLMQALSGHSRLRKLDLSHTDVGKLGCSALVDLLSNPNINLRVLHLANNNLGDAEAVALSSGMAGNISLKEIILAGNMGITEVGWQAIFNALSGSRCRWEKLCLDFNNINDAAAQSLSNALASNTTLKTLNLGYNSSITPTGSHALFQALLRGPTCVLEDLDLSTIRLNYEVMTSLADVLQSNRSLKSLNLFNSYGGTEDAWQTFFSAVLANPNSGMEKLDLGYCDINNAAIRALTNALVNNTKLKVLNLSDNYQITHAGWERFSSVLENPNSALEELHLDENEINDATLTSLLNSLAGNKKLKKLIFNHSDDWSPPLSVLCNADSIMDTYNSNHTLEKVGDEGDDLPEEFESLLRINRENSPSQAARLKIIKTHFNGGFITQPFVGMELNVVPYAMAWMGRDGEVSNHFYGFIRSMASLFENTPDEEK